MDIQVLDQFAIVDTVLQRIQAALVRGEVVSLATGHTFGSVFPKLDPLIRELQANGARPVLTHLDEYLDRPPEDGRSMVGQLVSACPVLGELMAQGRFLAVPASGDAGSLSAYRERLSAHGGVGLQLLGIGGNGHIAFNEPGSPVDSRLRVVELAPETRQPLMGPFGGHPPRQGVTAGVADILDASEIVLVALGDGKAAPIRRMIEGTPADRCPASFLNGHSQVTVLLDSAAATGLRAG